MTSRLRVGQAPGRGCVTVVGLLAAAAAPAREPASAAMARVVISTSRVTMRPAPFCLVGLLGGAGDVEPGGHAGHVVPGDVADQLVASGREGEGGPAEGLRGDTVVG